MSRASGRRGVAEPGDPEMRDLCGPLRRDADPVADLSLLVGRCRCRRAISPAPRGAAAGDERAAGTARGLLDAAIVGAPPRLDDLAVDDEIARLGDLTVGRAHARNLLDVRDERFRDVGGTAASVSDPNTGSA